MEFLSEPSLAVAVLEIVLGVALLARAADEFVEGAVELAQKARLSPVLVGAAVVGFGTSAPELLVSGIAAYNGDVDLGVGNIVGSNVANLSLVLAAAAFMVPLLVTRSVLAREAPLSLLSVLLFAYMTTGGLAVREGVVLLVALAASLGWVIAGGTGGHYVGDGVDHGLLAPSARTVVGLVGTVAGAQLLVWGAIGIADAVGLTGGFIGFTLVAVGTSLPELVTAVAAARRREVELILGNLLGSNMFNSLAVGGVIAVLGAGPIPDEGLRTVGIVIMVVVATGAWVAMVTRKRVYRLEAGFLLAAWLTAVVLLARTASG